MENLVAVTLLRKYGRNDAVFFYNKDIEVDFYVPEANMAIQASYSLQDVDTRKREIHGLVQLSKVLDIDRFYIITKDEEYNLSESGINIQVIPVWKWLLQ